jgi:hypothetical protein
MLKLKNTILSNPINEVKKICCHSLYTNLMNASANSCLSPVVLTHSIHHHQRMGVPFKHMTVITGIMAGTLYEMLGDRTLIPSGIHSITYRVKLV